MAKMTPRTADHSKRPISPKRQKKTSLWSWAKRAIVAALVLAFCFVSVVAYANYTAVWASRGRIFTDASKIPTSTRVGLVFGTTDRVNGRENLYFRYRIEAAAKVWQAGKLDTIIVSGSRSGSYSEPAKMMRALIALGIPKERIVPDFDGVRTLDSVVRAKEIFGAQSILFISQRFQNERAIYLAKAYGMDAYGFDARDVESHAGYKTKVREVGARVKMWLDVHFLDTRPQQLGEKVTLPK